MKAMSLVLLLGLPLPATQGYAAEWKWEAVPGVVVYGANFLRILSCEVNTLEVA